MERSLEWREREGRKGNLIIRRLVGDKGDLREKVGEVLEHLGVKVKIEEVRRLRTGKEGWREMVRVRLGNEEERKQVWREEGKLKRKQVWIDRDLMWKERKMRWNLKEIARREERRERRVKVEYDRILIEGIWWVWDEEEEVLKNGGERWQEVEAEGEKSVSGGRERVGGEEKDGEGDWDEGRGRLGRGVERRK